MTENYAGVSADVLAEEMRIKQAGAPCTFQFEATTILQIVSLLQLSIRHPGITPNQRELVRQFIDGAKTYFADCPSVLAVIEMGFDPRHDR